MITASQLKLLTTMTASELTNDIRLAGYKKDKFNTAKFLGMSNGQEFVYKVTYTEDGEEHVTKVFVKLHLPEGKITVDY